MSDLHKKPERRGANAAVFRGCGSKSLRCQFLLGFDEAVLTHCHEHRRDGRSRFCVDRRSTCGRSDSSCTTSDNLLPVDGQA